MAQSHHSELTEPPFHQTPADVHLQQAYREIKFALMVVQQAALLARRIQAEMISPALSKTDRSPVTVADFAIQALVARRLMEAFPADPLVAEEDSFALRDSASASSGTLLDQVTAFVGPLAPAQDPAPSPQDICDWIDRGRAGVGAGHRPAPTPARYWMLDPIDGTKGFLRGGQYAVALALMVDGQAQIGVLGCPGWNMCPAGACGGEAAGSLVIAARGLGAWATNLVGAGLPRPYGVGSIPQYRRLRVSERGDPAQARLLRSFEAGHTNVDQLSQFAAALGLQADPVRMDSQVKYAILAAGEGDLMLRLLSAENPNYREKAWDQAAGSLVVEEAGGRATDLDGKPFDFTTGRELAHNRGVLVSNGLLHGAALQALKAIGA